VNDVPQFFMTKEQFKRLKVLEYTAQHEDTMNEKAPRWYRIGTTTIEGVYPSTDYIAFIRRWLGGTRFEVERISRADWNLTGVVEVFDTSAPPIPRWSLLVYRPWELVEADRKAGRKHTSHQWRSTLPSGSV